MKDKQGRVYARLSKLKEGDTIETDSGFECRKPNEKSKVQKDSGGLYVGCSVGKHYLDGQLFYDNNDYLSGVYKV